MRLQVTLVLIVVAPVLSVVFTGCAAPGGKKIVRGIYAEPGPAVDNRIWAAYGAGYDIDTTEKHNGKSSIRCVNATDTEAHGASQQVRFDQDKPRPIIVAGWAKLEGVSGEADYHCSVYLDLTLKDGKSWTMKIAAFDPAKSGWQYAEQRYIPPAPIESARVYIFLRERKGTAWFDDIYVGEVLDEKGARGPNLLLDPGCEGGVPGDVSLRDQFFGKLKELGCNAFHMYRSVSWDKVMSPDAATSPPKIDPKDPLLDFIRDAHKRGFRVWLTAGVGLPRIENAKSPEFPFWPCVNNRWGEAYTRALVYFARYGVDGLGVVPDEWNYDNSAVRRLAQHSDTHVAAFYKSIGSYCNCDVCRKKFREQTGKEYPDPRKPWSSPDPVWALFTKFRYDSTSAWIRRSVEAIKKVNPKIVTDTMICVLPVCSDNRLHTGAAWDQIGVETGLDCLQTDPYIQLHNYLGDSTHYYTTETALHLTSANWKGRSGVTLEAARLRETYRDKEPVEVYGSALSCLVHGAREFFWWHFNHVTGKAKYVDPGPPSAQIAATYKVIRQMEDDLDGARTPGELLILYSRASEDTWDWLANKDVCPQVVGENPNKKRGFIAHRNVLYWLLRRGCPFQMTFLDNPDPKRLKTARVLLVPFPFSLKETEVRVIEDQARAGKTVILMSELSPVDELGQPLDQPRLKRLFAGKTFKPDEEGSVEAQLGKGKVIFLGGDFAVRLFQETKPMKDPKGTVPLPAFDEPHTAQLEKVLTGSLGKPPSLFLSQPERDVEATLIQGKFCPLLLLINWDFTQPVRVDLALPFESVPGQAEGWAILRDASVKTVQYANIGPRWTVELDPQEARLLRLTESVDIHAESVKLMRYRSY